MDRRKFLKAAGLSAGAVVMCRVPEAEASCLDAEVSSLVIKPEDIINDPFIGPVFDMNDDVGGLAGYYTGQLLLEHAKQHGLGHDEAIAVLQWGLRQTAVIGLELAKCVVTIVFADEALVHQIYDHHVFKEMYRRYGELLDISGTNVLGQYWSLSNRTWT